ncbi:EF-hand domain-containing protein [Plasmodiophora brassicae]|nr:hypothetical protein PBRA_007563 [Plasmodiophora brassicae]
MERWLLYDEIVDRGAPLRGVPRRTVPWPAAPHRDVDLYCDAFKDSAQFAALLDRDRVAAPDSEPERATTEASAYTPSVDSLLAMLRAGTCRDVLQTLPTSTLHQLRRRVAAREQALVAPGDSQERIPDAIRRREETGNEFLLSLVSMSMHSCGDHRSPSPYAAIVAKDHIGDLLRDVLRHVPRPLSIGTLLQLFPLQARLFDRWWRAKADSQRGTSDEIDRDEERSVDENDDEEEDDDDDALVDEVDGSSQAAVNLENYFQLGSSAPAESVLYEVAAPAPFSATRIGPRSRLRRSRQRELSMSLDDYNYYTRCRQASFVSRTNRFTFLRWIGVVQEDLARLPSAARQRYVAFLGLLAYDRLGCLVELAQAVRQDDSQGPITYAEMCEAIALADQMNDEIGPMPRVLQSLSSA